MEIDRGHYGDTSLDGVSVVALFYFPGAMHEAGGHLYPILPEGITEPQRDAVLKILGGESQPTGTVFDIFSALIEHEHDPIYRSITFDWHIESRKATVDIPGVLSAATDLADAGVIGPGRAADAAYGATINAGRIGPATVESSHREEFNFKNTHSSVAYFAYDGSGSRFFAERPR
jgi:hypothetical protein